MKVTPYERDFRYLVGEHEYLVDLLENNGNGRCTCRDFECHQWPKLRDGAKVARCKHLIEARLAAGEDLLSEAIKSKLKEQKHD